MGTADIDELKLSPDRLRRACDPGVFDFETTADLEPLDEVIGQDRAVSAIRFGLDISSSGFNLFLAGQPGTGKTTILRRILEGVAEDEEIPDDILYVHDFDDPDTPKVLQLPAGEGAEFRSDMKDLVEELKDRIPKAFEGKEYEEQKRDTAESYQEKKQELLEKLEEEAKGLGFEIKSTPMGFRTIPLKEGKPLTQEEYQGMGDEEREQLDEKMEELQARIRDVMSDVKQIDDELKEELRELNRQVAMNVLGTVMVTLRERYRDYDEILEYLEQVQRDIIDNLESFREDDQEQAQQLPIPGLRMRQQQEQDLTRYKVNLVVDNGSCESPPVVFEKNPTYANLVGRIERKAQFGALLTDFTMIRAGALAKANGGYLVLNIEDVLRNPFSYEALKRALDNGEVRIEDISERYGLFSASTLRPAPIPLDVKVCLIGNPIYYHLLFAYDETFREIFKVKADFDYQTDRGDDGVNKFGAFIARLVEREDLPDFDRNAVAAVIEESSRFVEDQEKLSLRFAELNDLLREAAYWARQEEADTVTREHIDRAVEEAEYRQSLTKERVQDIIHRDILMVDTEDATVGQINGLAIHMLGDYLFGRPSRITAAVALGRDGIVNIERRVQMSHGTHDKGVLILSGFLNSRFGQERPMALTASLTFEQSYGEIAGDSASSTELYVLLSALADVPIKQGIAVTGSVNQKGQVQAIGGVNQKIEGFFDICERRGLTGDQGVIIPSANVQHLMLRGPVIEAVERGDFHVWAVDHVDQGIEILTGLPAGERDEDGAWTPDSVNARVADRLESLGQKLLSWSKEHGDGAQPEVVVPREDAGEGPPPPPRPPDRPEG
ncbi:MAG: AAA family ATPase [Acidobacteriota bacterium]